LTLFAAGTQQQQRPGLDDDDDGMRKTFHSVPTASEQAGKQAAVVSV